MHTNRDERSAEVERSHLNGNLEVMHLSCVTFTYYGETNAVLRDCSGVVWEGEIIVISGGNGSGKSTLCRLLAGVMNPDAGTMMGELNRLSSSSCLSSDAGIIGYIGGEAAEQFVIGIVEDELAFGPENLGLERVEISRRIERELNAVGMKSYRHAHVEQLSGGQQQRVAAAAVWTMEPDLLVIDDAWNALDSEGRTLFSDALYQWYINGDQQSPLDCNLTPLAKRPRTLIVSTSRLSELDQEHPLWAKAEYWSLEQGKLLQTGRDGATTCKEHEHSAISEAKHQDCLAALSPVPLSVTFKQQTVLTLEQLHVQYRDGYKVLNNVNAQLQAGEGVVLRGSNGSGKSSLLKVLSGAIARYKGHIKLQSKEIEKLRDAELAKHIGYVSQRATNMFITGRVIDECMDRYEQLGIQICDSETWSLEQLEAIGLKEHAYMHPHDLSVSAQRMLSLWLATVHEPSLLLLDEPTAGLDECSALEVIAWCNRERRRGAAVIAATHDPLWLSDQGWKQWITERGTIRSC